jgi:hypothetical protein
MPARLRRPARHFGNGQPFLNSTQQLGSLTANCRPANSYRPETDKGVVNAAHGNDPVHAQQRPVRQVALAPGRGLTPLEQAG